MILDIVVEKPGVYKELLSPHRYKAFFGGRGSAKSHSFATALVQLAVKSTLRILCAREFQKSIKDSVKRLVDDKIKNLGLDWFFESTDTEIRGKNGSLFLFSGLKTNIESVKSMEGINICWVEEANTVSQRSLDILIPTIRVEGSELWFSWNPESELDPVDIMFRGKVPPPDSVVQEVSYLDNPWFSDVLVKEMLFDKQTDLKKYNHVWLGGYKEVAEGAYYAEQLALMVSEGRLSRVPHDTNAQVHAAWDLGIGDATAIWFAQFIGREIHLIDYIEDTGKSIVYYAEYLQKQPYIYAPLILPHDARARELGTGKTIEEVLIKLGFKTQIAPKIDPYDGIEAVRNMLGKTWVDADKCAIGMKALRAYRQNYDEKLKISRGVLHDWSSHGADAIRYLAVSQPVHRIQRVQYNLSEFDRYSVI